MSESPLGTNPASRGSWHTARPVTRRDAIAAIGALLGSLAGQRHIQGEQPAAEEKIDCHVHFYDPTRPQGVPWPAKGNAALYRPRLPQDFLAVARPQGVTRCIVIEASSWFTDNRWLLELAAREPCIAGVIGRVAPEEASFAEGIAGLAQDRKFRGIRVGLPAVQQALADPAVLGRLALLIDHDLTLDVNGGPDVLEPLAALAARLPKLSIVLNHQGNPKIDGREPPQDWRSGIGKLAEARHVYCKWSAYAENTRERPAPTDVDFYRPVFDHVWRAFGAERMLFGSDWPVSEPAADYAALVKIADAYLASRGAAERRQVFQANTLQAYAIA